MTATAPRPGPQAPPLVRLLLLVTAVTCALLAGAPPAGAHAALISSNPPDGAVVQEAPERVTLDFSEKVALSDDSVRVMDPDAKRVDTGKVEDLGTEGSVRYGVQLKPDLPDGTYTVAWQLVSADSHPVSGAFTFSVGAPSATTVSLPEQEAGGGLVGFLYDIARYTSYAGFLVLVGGAAFVLACWPGAAAVRSVQRLVVQGWIALTGATIATLLLRSPYTGSGKLADALDLAGLRDVLETKTGAALVSRLLLLAAAALFIAVLFGAYARQGEDRDGAGEGEEETAEDRESRLDRKDLTFGLAVGGTVVAAGLAATWALSEHASAGIQPGVAMPVDVLHLLAVAVWLGGLASLLAALYRGPSVPRTAVRHFSRLAFGSVVVLAATGLYQSWRQVGSWSALTGTSYGQLLLVKIGLVVLLVGIAYLSRRWTARIGEEAQAHTEPAAGDRDAEEAGEAGRDEVERARTGRDETGRDKAEKKVTVPEAAAATASAPSASAAAPASSEAPGRAAQLARQRAAADLARRKRIRDADPHRTGLRRSVLAEAGVAVVLLAVTTVLTSTEPGRTEEETAKATAGLYTPSASGPVTLALPFDTKGEDGKGTVKLFFEPGRVGGNTLDVRIVRPNGRPLDVPEVKVSFTLESKGIGPLPVTPDRIGTGNWTATGVQIPLAGEWKIAVTVRTSDIDQVTIDKTVQIG
ncbi:copper resistance CopC/CopD family protein [Streptomyces sp. GC420]|uniref:copper resistance CopC/CopD family protein n=1 Tax=Streptomyces sp. GC420 TaxID=2697568 RepID=UPI001414D2C6|nr:copper resistance protein CopC [Streptomyces sp. GC420]NBM20310.1 hypothetical protein [Streptomyces sp. GC420]